MRAKRKEIIDATARMYAEEAGGQEAGVGMVVGVVEGAGVALAGGAIAIRARDRAGVLLPSDGER